MTDQNYALTHLFHPSGAKVDIPITAAGISPEAATNLIISVSALLAAGFTVEMPGLEDGELVEEAAFVSRRTSNDDTPIIAFYKAHPKMEKKFIHSYLDTAEQISEFEAATGLRFASLPVFDGDKDITKDHKNAAKYIVQLPHPVKLVFNITDRWKRWNEEGGNGQQPQKYTLLRYSNVTPHTPQVVVAPILPAMTYEQARLVKTPNGTELGTLDAEKLKQIETANNSKLTDEMRQAAKIILNEMEKEPA